MNINLHFTLMGKSTFTAQETPMKHYLLKFAGAAVLGFATSFGAAFAQPLVVAVDTAFVPFEFKQGDEYVGFDIDLRSEERRVGKESVFVWVSMHTRRCS